MDLEKMGFKGNTDFSDEMKVLKVALENEVTGRNLYLQYAEKVRSDLAKKVFAHLANEELNHIRDITEYMESVRKGTAVDVDKMISDASLKRTEEFFGKMASHFSEQVAPADDDNKAREIAMEVEKRGYEYYEKAMGVARTLKLRKFFKWLMEQEQSHFMLIRNAFEFSNDPDSWFARHEHWTLEG